MSFEPHGVYTFTNYRTGLCLQANGSGQVWAKFKSCQVHDASLGENEFVIEVSGSWYRIRNLEYKDTCLTATSAYVLINRTCNNTNDQKWGYSGTSTNVTFTTALYHTVLDNRQNGDVYLNTANGGGNQLWTKFLNRVEPPPSRLSSFRS